MHISCCPHPRRLSHTDIFHVSVKLVGPFLKRTRAPNIKREQEIREKKQWHVKASVFLMRTELTEPTLEEGRQTSSGDQFFWPLRAWVGLAPPTTSTLMTRLWFSLIPPHRLIGAAVGAGVGADRCLLIVAFSLLTLNCPEPHVPLYQTKGSVCRSLKETLGFDWCFN